MPDYWGSSPTVLPSQGVQAGEVLCAARTHLNDDEGLLWPDYKLFPKLREAHRKLQLQLVLNGVPVVSNQTTSTITVVSGTTDFSTVTNYPTNMLSPIWMKERDPGQQMQDFVDMTQVDFLPQLNPSTELIWWSWIQQKIFFLGSTMNREVLLRYRAGIKLPTEVTDPIGPFFGEIYLSFKTAALALSLITGNEARVAYLESQANDGLETLLASIAKETQNLPAKRRPYHRGRGRSRVLRDF